MGRKSKEEIAAEESLRHGAVMAAEDGVGAAFTPGAVVAPVDFDAKEIAEALNLWWKSGDGDNFYVCSEGGRWDRWNMTAVVDLMRSLPDRLVRIKVREGEQISEVKRVFMYVRQHRVLDEVFPALSGYPDGMHTLETGERWFKWWREEHVFSCTACQHRWPGIYTHARCTRCEAQYPRRQHVICEDQLLC